SPTRRPRVPATRPRAHRRARPRGLAVPGGLQRSARTVSREPAFRCDSAMTMPTLLLQALVPDAFAPYGTIVGAGERIGRPVNDGTAQRIDLPDPDVVDHGGRPALAVFRARAVRLPFVVRALERHRRGSQTFVA